MTTHPQFCFRSVLRAVVAFVIASTASCHGSSGNAEGAPDGAQATVEASDDSPPILVTSPTGNRDATSCDDTGPGASGCVEEASTLDAESIEGGTGLVCGSGTIACGGACVPDDVRNCGACGNACPTQANAMAACSPSDAGSYACVSSCVTGFSLCAGACVDLTSDGANCGACGQTCAPGACAAGKCQRWLVAQADDSVVSMASASLATDGTNVVWLQPDVGVSEAPVIPVPNGTPILLAQAIAASPPRYQQITMENGVVAWTEGDPNIGMKLDMWTALEGQTNSGSTSGLPPVNGCAASGIALNSTGTDVYFVSACGSGTSGAYLWSCNLGGTVACTMGISTGSPSPQNAIVFSSNVVFFTDSVDGIVGQYPVGSMDGSPIETDQGAPFLLTADSSFVYWASTGPNLTFSISRTSQANPTSPPQPVLPATGGVVTGIATDGTNLYVAGAVNSGDTRVGVIGSVPVAGGAPLKTLYSSNALPLTMSSTGGVIVWMDSTDYAIYALHTH